MFLLTNNVEILPDATDSLFSRDWFEVSLNYWRVFDSFGTSNWQELEHIRAKEITWEMRGMPRESNFAPARPTFGLGYRM